MKIFIVHKHEDADRISLLKEQINSLVNVDLLSLDCDPNFTRWFEAEAKPKIKESDVVLVALGELTHKGNGVDKEIEFALKKKKPILLYRLNEDKKDVVNLTLYKKDTYNNVDKPLFKEIALDDLKRIVKYGYYFDVAEKLNSTNEPKRDQDLIEQYKAYLATSEEVLTRRQNTSNFYTTLNTSMLTISVTVAGILLGLQSINGLLVVSLIFFAVSVICILLNFNWMSLLESYGRLNGAKIKVLAEMEKNLPANIYDTEWKVMSEKLCAGKYVSFTSIEKRIPIFFIILSSLLLIASIVMFVFAII